MPKSKQNLQTHIKTKSLNKLAVANLFFFIKDLRKASLTIENLNYNNAIINKGEITMNTNKLATLKSLSIVLRNSLANNKTASQLKADFPVETANINKAIKTVFKDHDINNLTANLRNVAKTASALNNAIALTNWATKQQVDTASLSQFISNVLALV